MYLKGGHYDLAAHLAEEMGDLAAASHYYLEAGDPKAAAEVQLQLENREKAASLFSRAGQHYRAAEIYESLDQLEEAAQQYQRAGMGEKAALLFARAGKPLNAVTLFEHLISQTGHNEFGSPPTESDRAQILKYHRFCGKLLLETEQPERAAHHFEAALCLEQAADAWRIAGQVEKAADILLRLQKPEQAYAVMQEAGKDLSNLSPAVQAAILSRQGNHCEAARVLEQAGSHYQAAQAWAESGDDGRAAQLYEKEGDLDQASIHYIRAGEYGDAARLFEANRDYKHASDMYRKAGRDDDAARVLVKSGEMVAAAMIHYDRKDFDPVIKILQKVKAGQLEFRKATFTLGRVFAQQGLHTLAVDKFVAALDGRDVNEETLPIYYALAQAHEANLRPREALQIHRKILAFDYHYKDVLSRMKELEDQVRNGSDDGTVSPAQSAAAGRMEPGRYRIERSLGVGKLGEVFHATDTVLDRPVAFRRLQEAPHEAGKADRFVKEATGAARLSHPHIVSTFDTGEDDEGKFIISELAEGKTLRELLDQKVRFEANRVVDIGRQVLEALDHAHGLGVLHRNLRPENIFLTEDDRAAVADFGLSVRLSDLSPEELSSGRQIQYTPPEALRKQRVDERSDLYCFGILIYELAVGHAPFRGNAVGHQQVNNPVPLPGPHERPLPAFLKAVILRCLEKSPEDRYPNARAVLEELKVKDVVPGMVVAQRYEVMAEVGRGGMGKIFRARDLEMDETVALKFLSGEISAERVARLVREIKTARSVIHPNVVRVFTLDKWREHRFIVMEYIDGVSLERWMERTPTPSLQDKLRVAIQTAGALNAAHQAGIIHRDIKPENILVTVSGEAKVLDFGIARAETHDVSTSTGGIVFGSPMYIAPELIQGKPFDHRSDIYSLGAVFYYLFTGRKAFPGKDVKEVLLKHFHKPPRPPHEVDPTLPRPISDTILRALRPDPERRFSSAADLARTLSGVLEASVA